jgi:tetratricopeptide (TPR) repeat protein
VGESFPARMDPSENPRRMKFSVFVWLVLLLIGLGILRSAIATRLDGFTLDEAYHIASGVSYVRNHDFRLNPEHPPLVKLWVGAVMAATGFHSEPLRKFTDKPDERDFTENEVFRLNDPDSVQRRARAAMYVLNGLLLIALAFALERLFNPWVALGSLLFLVIDPTVAAHWPVVMTDLPVALLSATAIVLTTLAFRDWMWRDLAACSAVLGLDLATKHSAPIVLLSVAAIGVWLAFWLPLRKENDSRWKRLLKVGGVLAGALVILWGFYLFRYSETRSAEETFNRPLALKIEDVGTTYYHAVLSVMDKTRVVPRAYLWGFADTVHAGMEGRPYPQLFMGKVYSRKGPRYFFPVVLAVKLPIGLLFLSIAGLVLFFSRRLPKEWDFPAGVILAAAILFLLVLAAGATYAGVRHALPVLVLLSIAAGLFTERALAMHSMALKVVTLVAFLFACISTIPVLRPWEYYNELAGGTKNSYKLFCDEGTDLGQRTKEIANYYNRYLKPKGERPDLIYFSSENELKGRNVEYLGRDMERDFKEISQPERTGTIFVSPDFLLRSPFWQRPALQEATPVERLGNLFIYRGTFHLPASAASGLYWHALEKLYSNKKDEAAAEDALQKSVAMDPSAFFVHIELGNRLLKRGARQDAFQQYTDALKYAPQDPVIRRPIEAQIQRMQQQPDGKIPPLRNPFME